jgi:hypothetical protein
MARDGFVELAHHLRGDAGGARCPRHRPQDVDVGDVLQGAHIGLRARRAAADQQHRRTGERGIGHSGDRIGDARPGGRHGDAERAGQLRMGMRHVDRGTLVAHVDYADAAACQIGWMWPPCRPKMRSTLRASRKRAIQAEHAVSSVLRSMALTATVPNSGS